MNESFELVKFIALGSALCVVGLIIYFRSSASEQLNELLANYYKLKGEQIENISKLSFSEGYEYGTIFNFYSVLSENIYRFNFFEGTFFRKLEVKCKNGDEQIRFVEIRLKKREIISCNEFKKFNV